MGQVLGVVPDRDLRAQLFEARGDVRPREIAAGDLERGGQQQDLRDAAHPDAPRAHEVDAPQPQKPHRVASASNRSFARSAAALGLARDFAFWAIAVRRARSFMISAIVPARLSASKSFSSITIEAPAL